MDLLVCCGSSTSAWCWFKCWSSYSCAKAWPYYCDIWPWLYVKVTASVKLRGILNISAVEWLLLILCQHHAVVEVDSDVSVYNHVVFWVGFLKQWYCLFITCILFQVWHKIPYIWRGTGWNRNKGCCCKQWVSKWMK